MASRKFSDLPPARQGLLLAVLPVALAIVVFYDFALPLSGQAEQVGSQVATLHAQNARGRLLEIQRAELAQKITRSQKRLAELRAIVPDQPADDQFVSMLYSTARASSVHLRDLDASTPAKNAYFMQMPFRAHIDGTYYAMLDFFRRLAGSQRIVNVSGLSLASVKSARGAGSYQTSPSETVAANCVLTTFYASPRAASDQPRPGGAHGPTVAR
ncbi:MAG: type 4a pilus biogenesis protein PilO [Terriglobia bacterium]